MKTPKLLPWYASKAGVPIERATVLWSKAASKAMNRTGQVGTSEYWAMAMELLRAALQKEQSTFCAPHVTQLVRSQNRIWRLPLTAMEDMLCTMSSTWPRRVGSPRRAA